MVGATGGCALRGSSARVSWARERWRDLGMTDLLLRRTRSCTMAAIRRPRRKDSGQLGKALDADLWRSQAHAGAIGLVEHPVRQFPREVRPLLGIDEAQSLTAPIPRDLNGLSEQRMPGIRNGRRSKTVCSMSLVGRVWRGTRTRRRRTDPPPWCR